MAGIHAGEEIFRRPIRLKKRADTPAIWEKFIFVAIDHVGLTMRLQQGNHFVERIGTQFVVVIQQSNKLAVCQSKRPIGGSADSFVLRRKYNLDSSILLREFMKHLSAT